MALKYTNLKANWEQAGLSLGCKCHSLEQKHGVLFHLAPVNATSTHHMGHHTHHIGPTA